MVFAIKRRVEAGWLSSSPVLFNVSFVDENGETLLIPSVSIILSCQELYQRALLDTAGHQSHHTDNGIPLSAFSNATTSKLAVLFPRIDNIFNC